MRATVNGIQKLWTDCPPAVLAKNTASLNYIRELASNVGVNISRWNITGLFGVDGGPNLIEDVRAINRILLEKVRTASSADEDMDSSVESVLPAADIPRLTQFFNSRGTDLHRLRRDLSSQEQTLASYERGMQQAVTAMLQIKANISRAEKTNEGKDKVAALALELSKLLDGGFWCDPIFVGNMLWLRSSADLVISYKKPAAGIDVTVSLGKFSASFNLEDGSMRVFPYQGNKRRDDHYHPHVNNAGVICWGTALELRNRFAADLKIKDVFDLLQSLLITYCDDNPYRGLDDFVDAPNYGRRAENLMSPHYTRDLARRNGNAAAEEASNNIQQNSV